MTPRVAIQMHKGTNWFSRLIRWFTRSTYSHVSVWFVARGVVIESLEPGGVRMVNADLYQGARLDGRIALYRYRTPLTVEEEQILYFSMKEKLGDPYDWRGIVDHFLRRPHPTNKQWTCSEIAAYGSVRAGRPFANKPVGHVTPGDIATSTELVFWEREIANVD